jgi:hypothetical protein
MDEKGIGMEAQVTKLGIGDLQLVECDGEAVIRFYPRYGMEAVWSASKQGDGTLEITVGLGKLPPRIGQEVTAGGVTFEVIGVRCDNGGYQVCRDTDGIWVPWQ